MSRRDSAQPSIQGFVRVHSMPMLATILAIALLAGVFAGWTAISLDIVILNLHVSIWAFLVVWAAMIGYTAYKRVPSGVIGVGLHVMGLAVLTKPVAWVTSLGTVPQGPATREATIDSLASLFIWSLVFLVLAGVLFVVGNYFRSRAERTTLRRARSRLRSRDTGSDW